MTENTPSKEAAKRRGLSHPEWYRVPYTGGRERLAMRALLRDCRLNTVCASAKCPNLCDCWKRRTATFMILGDICTRNCRFCAVQSGLPQKPDPQEPIHLAQAVSQLQLRYAVITCVTRDDLPDGGAVQMAAAVQAIHAACPATKVEVLCSDYGGQEESLSLVLRSSPQVFGHNLETVSRLTPSIRSRADYQRSLQVLRYAANWCDQHHTECKIKSGLMLGLGETEAEIRAALADLRQAGVQILTLGQYLRPGVENCPVVRHLPPQEFASWKQIAEQEFAFSAAVCGPLVRSSYLAEEALQACCGKIPTTEISPEIKSL